MPFRDLIERQCQIEHLARIDLSVVDEFDQVWQETAHWSGSTVEVHVREKHLFTIELDTDRKSTRLNSSHLVISYAVFCLKKKTKTQDTRASHLPVAWLFLCTRLIYTVTLAWISSDSHKLEVHALCRTLLPFQLRLCLAVT